MKAKVTFFRTNITTRPLISAIKAWILNVMAHLLHMLQYSTSSFHLLHLPRSDCKL